MLDRLPFINSATKYPSIDTYHVLGERGRLTNEVTPFSGHVYLTEKVDGCLTSDTRISMADGTRKPISKILAGEEVLGTDENGRLVATPVTNTFNNGRAEEWMRIKGRRANAGRGSSFFAVHCTPNHRFWVSGDYRAAEDLKIGDRVTMIRSESELTPCQFSVLLGKLLGDGYLHMASSGSASVVWGHRVADESYVDWTLRALGDIASASRRTLTSGYGTEMKIGRSTFHPSIAEKFGSMTSSGKKRIPEWVADALDPIALAFWYMDDGSLTSWEGQEDRSSFATNGFTEEDCKVLLRGLARLGINGSLMEDRRGYLTIRLNTEASERMFLLVAPYVPPVMQRKLPSRYRGHDGWLPPIESSYKNLLVEQEIEEIRRNVTDKSSNRYDLETGTHNFFANGVLVHNSNARIVMDRDGDYVIGEREGLLYAKGDRVANPSLGIVEALRDFADLTDLAPPNGDLRVYFLEVYGGKIGQAHKNYTSGGIFGFRLFDVVHVPLDVLSWPRERIASWRDHGGQSFATEDELVSIASKAQIPLVPRLAVTESGNLPVSIGETYDWLGHYLPRTNVALDDGAKGRAEGIVLRSFDRSVIRKARFADYERTLNIKNK